MEIGKLLFRITFCLARSFPPLSAAALHIAQSIRGVLEDLVTIGRDEVLMKSKVRLQGTCEACEGDTAFL